MKKLNTPARIGCLLTILLTVSASLCAQTLTDFFDKKDTTALYLGIDFTRSKLINDPKVDVNLLRDRDYTRINELIVTEAKKYDVSALFHKKNIAHDLGFVNAKNMQANVEEITSLDSNDIHHLKEEDIESLVKNYDFGENKGLGILFVMEAMNNQNN